MNTWGPPAKGWPSFSEAGVVGDESLYSRAASVLKQRERCRGIYEDEWGRVSLDAAVRIACHGSPEHNGAQDPCWAALEHLQTLLGRTVSAFNDDPRTTDTDVLALLERA